MFRALPTGPVCPHSESIRVACLPRNGVGLFGLLQFVRTYYNTLWRGVIWKGSSYRMSLERSAGPRYWVRNFVLKDTLLFGWRYTNILLEMVA